MTRRVCIWMATLGALLALAGGVQARGAAEVDLTNRAYVNFLNFWECVADTRKCEDILQDPLGFWTFCDWPGSLCKCVGPFIITDVCAKVDQDCGNLWICDNPTPPRICFNTGFICLEEHCDTAQSVNGNPPCQMGWRVPPGGGC